MPRPRGNRFELSGGMRAEVLCWGVRPSGRPPGLDCDACPRGLDHRRIHELNGRDTDNKRVTVTAVSA